MDPYNLASFCGNRSNNNNNNNKVSYGHNFRDAGVVDSWGT